MPVPESDVLKPVDPSITDSDEWEIFVLSDAYAVYESNGKPANLLDAYADTPLTVVGRLEGPGRGQSKCYLQRSYKPIEIELRHVTRFSYGEMTDGAYAIWAQGKAGWFEVRPARKYQSIYEDMVQAVQILYFVTDIYNESRKRSGGPSPELLFQEYAEDERFPCADPAAAIQIFHKHHIFLIMCFLNRAQSIRWSNTPIYQYFRKQFPDEFNTCKARIEGRYVQPLPQRPTRTPKPSAAPASISQDALVAPKSHVGRAKAAAENATQTPKKDDNWWEAATIFEFMQKVVNLKVLRAGRNQITLERVAQLTVKRYEIEDLETATNVLLVHARNLCYMMDHPRRKTVQFFSDEPIYQELSAGHDLSAAEQRRAEAVELRPRKDHATLKDEEIVSSDTSDDEDVITTPIRRPPGRRKKGRLSVLRPKGGKSSGKSKGKGKLPLPRPDPSDDSNSAADSSDQAPESEDIDTPTQALSPSREKRKLKETTTDEESTHPHRKRQTSTSIIPESPPTTSESDEENPTTEPSALLYRPSDSSNPPPNTQPITAPPLISTPLPTYAPNGPRDSWICALDGCTQRIYGCSKPLGRQLITEHLEDHAKGREKVVGILWREQDKLNIPVSNLIKKIREMSEASSQLFPLGEGEKVLKKPVKRPL